MTLITQEDGRMLLTLAFDPVSVFLTVAAVVGFVAGFLMWKEGAIK